MIHAKYFLDELLKQGFQFFSGVPCSYLTALINAITARKKPTYLPSSSEGEALAMAAGAWLSGKMPVVMCQNSGLGNMINPLTSLNEPFQIPVLLLITWRGYPGEKDEPQHKMMGKITTKLLELMEIPWDFFPQEEKEVNTILQKAIHFMNTAYKPYALLLKKDSFLPDLTIDAASIKVSAEKYPSRKEVLEVLLNAIPHDSPIIATTGKTGRELYTLQDKESHLYCVGSMGYANAVAHGIALNTHKKVFVIDGDGAVIMHLGNLATIGAAATDNFVHIILDNQVYDSTGAQPTVSPHICFTELAKSLNYCATHSCDSLDKLTITVQKAITQKGPILIYMRIRAGSMRDLGRPSQLPHIISHRLRAFLGGQSC
jgi:phosphonopyruvate decarboxylase